MDRLLTRSHVEDTFGIYRRYLEIAAMRGDGPIYVKIDRSVRYRRIDVENWISACAVEPGLTDSNSHNVAHIQRGTFKTKNGA